MWFQRAIVILVTSSILFACQSSEDFKTGPSGLQYKIIRTGQGDKIMPGQFLKLKVRQAYNDSLLASAPIPQYQPYDSLQLSPEAYQLFSTIRSGDSLVFKMISDSAFKTSRPTFAKKKGWLITFVKVEGILGSEIEARADLELEKKSTQQESHSSNPQFSH